MKAGRGLIVRRFYSDRHPACLTPPLRRAMVFADGRQETSVSEDIRIQFDVVAAPPDAA